MEADRQLNDRSNSALDVALQDRHETGAAAQIDDNSFRQLRDAGKSAIPEAFQDSRPRAFVPLQYGYPAEFLAEWTETYSGGAHGTSLGLFVRPTGSDPWRVTLYIYASSASPDPLPELAIDTGGHARRLSPAEFGRLRTSPEDLAQELANYWNGYRDPNFVLPRALATGAWTTARNERTRADVSQKAAQLKVEQFATSPGPYRYHSAYRTQSGSALVFLSLVEHITLSVGAPLSFDTPLAYRDQQELPLAVTNGARELSIDVLYTVAAIVAPGGPARVIDGYSGPISGTRIR